MRFALPEQAKALAMPAPPRFWFDAQQGILPAVQSADEEDKEHTIDPREARAFDRPVEDDELLAQQKVFHDQLRFTARDVNHDAARRPVLIGWSSAR